MRAANVVGGSFFESEQKPINSRWVDTLSEVTVCAVAKGTNEALHRGNLGVLLRFPGARWRVFIFTRWVLIQPRIAAFSHEELANQR